MSRVLDIRQDAGSDRGQQVLKLLSNPFQASIQLQAFWASLATSLGITLLLAIIFSLLRPRHTLVYAPKVKFADSKHAPPPMSKSPFAWIKPVWQTNEEMLVDKLGMDAAVFMRFLRMLRNMFVTLAVLGVVVMIPVNVSLGVKSLQNQENNAFAVMTPLYVFGRGMWAQVVLAWILDIVVAFFLWWNYRKIYQLRRTYFQSPEYQNSLHARSVMITDIPSDARSDEGILRLTDKVNSTGSLPKPTIGRNVKILPDLLEEHEEAVRKLESVLAVYLKNPDRLPVNRPTMKPMKGHRGKTSGGKVDAIDHLTERIRLLESQINDIRERIDKRDAMSYGFASWEQIPHAHTVAYAARRKGPNGSKIRLAPRPNDVIWQNLGLSRATRVRKRWLNAVWITLLTIVWTPLNAGIAVFLSNLSNLGMVWPAFQGSLIRNKTWWALVQGIAAPAITSLVYLILPIIFRRLQIKAGDTTKTDRERHVLRNLYNFFTLNNLLIFSLFSAVWQYITYVVDDLNQTSGDKNVWNALQRGQFFVTVTSTLCQISPFWVTWLLQRQLGAAIDLAQLVTLFWVWFSKTFMSPTPRQLIEWTAPPAFDYASYYNYFLFYTTITFCFATLQPIVLVVTAFYFTLDSVLKKYLLMYVFVTKTESGGQFWRTLFNRIVFATILSNIIIGVVVKARADWTLVYALVPPVLLMLAFKFYCARTFDSGYKYYNRAASQIGDHPSTTASAKAISRASVRLRHPALDKPLMTPMVDAKAKHVLAQIYSGRRGSDMSPNAGYSDIAMEPMTESGRPNQDAPFEFVSEAQQDFSYYKNRPDFREEGGEIYGRGDDLISLRSSTPMSLMPGQGRPTTPFKDDMGGDMKGVPDRNYTPSPPPGLVAPIARRPVSGSNFYAAQGTNARGYEQVRMDGGYEGDISLRHGPYTDPNDDSANLLRGAGDLSTPNGDFMTVDRWQTNGSIPNSLNGTPQGHDGGSYDYFRGGHR